MKTLKRLFGITPKPKQQTLKELQQTKFTDELINFNNPLFNIVAVERVL